MAIVHKGPSWFLRVKRAGRKLGIRLDVPVEGNPPRAGSGQRGDAAFERSRGKAELRAAQILRDLDQRESEESVVRRMHEIRTGRLVGSVRLDDLVKRWENMPRRRKLSDGYLAQGRNKIAEFVAFVKAKSPGSSEMADVTPRIATEFMQVQQNRGVSDKTFNNVLTLLGPLFEKLQREAGLTVNPFDEIPLREVETIGRVPFSPEELEQIIELSNKPEHAFIRPIAITGICTAMRRGDCCTLQWNDVDLEGGFISVIAHKPGAKVTIPLFAALRDVLRRTARTGTDVFPEQATMYRCNPDGITHRVQRLLADAGFYDVDVGGTTKGHRGNVHVARERGLRRANIRGFQSFRVTFVTLALLANIPEELVRRITGHAAVEIVREHYFKPGRDALRVELLKKMPLCFVRERPSDLLPELTAAILKSELESMSESNWGEVRDRLLGRIETALAQTGGMPVPR